MPARSPRCFPSLCLSTALVAALSGAPLLLEASGPTGSAPPAPTAAEADALFQKQDWDGKRQMQRMTFENLGSDRVRQFGEISNDGGVTWKPSFDLTYVRRK